jgi:aspartyl-tRNA(Asn)/glutamyl-tRNA(Gln) amidotransferase subunit A
MRGLRVNDLTLSEVAAAIAGRKLSSVEAVRACVDRIERLDRRLRAFITLDAEAALARARALDAEGAGGRLRGPLHGVPLAYKDLCHVPGLPTSCGTRTAEYFTSATECTAVARLSAAGAVTLGKLNMSELALGPFGDNPHHGNVDNPWKTGHVSGGSSSGSGAAVAAGLACGALGSDTGGSIRLPAACCGIVGVKPTYGRVSRAGAMPLSWSLDHLGPMARTVRDATLMLDLIAGHDAHDATSSRRPAGALVAALDGSPGGLRVALPENYYYDGVAAEVREAVESAGRVLVSLGVRVQPMRLPDPASLNDVANILARSESASIHARVLRDRPHELGAAVRSRLEVGLHVSAHDYLQASRLRARLTREFIAEVFGEVDVVLAPTIPEPAPALATVTAGPVDEIVRRMGRFSRLTRPFNVLGLPVVSLPCGFAADGRPLGMQLAGRPFDEATVLRLAQAYEQATDWHLRRPQV